MLTASNTKATAAPKLLDVLIIGGGLSGLMVAHQIQQQLPSVSWKLLEAQPALGGRLSNAEASSSQGYIDMGGAWIWPQQQPYMKKLVKTLDVQTFRQIDDPSSTRFVGGAVQLVHKLAETLPTHQIQLETGVTKCSLEEHTSSDSTCSDRLIRVETTSDESYLAKRVVVAVPPRVMQATMDFSPSLSDEKQRAVQQSHTWMAGVTKVALVYKDRFWPSQVSNMGLPGGGGPAFQLYDASTEDGSLAAITFFALVPPGSPALTDDQVLADQVSTQLQSVWKYHGMPELAKRAKDYSSVHVRRWPMIKYISEDASPTKIQPHPQPIRGLSATEWDNQLLFAGTETDRFSPGVMEGAVSAAHRVFAELKESLNLN
jgi:monoamine oxidase